MLGKRKRDSAVLRRSLTSNTTESEPNHQQLFKQYFESRFEPLPEEQLGTPSLIEEESQSDDSELKELEWDGFSDTENSITGVEVVDHAKKSTTEADDHQPTGFKSFMASFLAAQILLFLTISPEL